MSPRARRLLLAIAACLAAALPARSEEAASARRWKPVSFRLATEMRVSHESNVFHVARRREPDFETETAPYRRFHDMQGPGDVVTRLSLELAWRWKHVSKRAIELRFRTRAHLLAENDVADGVDLRLSGRFDVTRHDRIRLDVGDGPDHFAENASYEAFPGISVHGRRNESRLTTTLSHEHEWSRKWSTEVGWSWRRRDFRAPFDARDERRDGWLAGVTWKPLKKLDVEMSLERHDAQTGVQIQEGLAKDRSHVDRIASLEARIDLPARWRLTPSATLREREYTTPVAPDAARYGRTDRRWGFGLQAERRFKGPWRLAFGVSHLENYSGRLDAEPPRAYGYDDLEAFAEVGWSR